MPLVKIQTNQPLDSAAAESLAKAAIKVVAEVLGKPEAVTMATVDAGKTLVFGGTSEPAALFEIEGLGSDAEPMQALTTGLCELAESTIGVSGSRIFVKLASVPRGFWAQDRKVF